MFIVKQFKVDYVICELNYKREFRKYDPSIKYANKSFGQFFADYLGPSYFNSMHFEFKKKVIQCQNINKA